jgi:hypothetical protein
MASSALINTFAAEFSKFGNFMFDHVRKTMAADPDAELPDVDEMVRLYLQPDEPIKLKKPRAKAAPKKVDAEVTQVPAATKAGKTKELCTAITGKGTQCTRCATQGQVFCLVHLKASQAKSGDKNKKPRAAPKKKKAEDMPKHSHPIEEIPETGSCDLCESHGNPLNEDDAESQFEVKKIEPEEDEEETVDKDPDYILEEEEFDED